ncbi:twin-arginine translocase subunit TatB [Paracoccus liaowanqingii]|uniref:Sec-independent protein translocase protein TatB n=1 Tax=Paracoccus liaowanqingii TaxID=2560053 RepID=A0A4V1BJ23_9RHOB|nr:Sec-independent protein translocase protein TatB [Paracoccus liaowanqingii]QBX34792.1 twin-arginine translocase subunit TatB [Paracoccus liaowanqingii]
MLDVGWTELLLIGIVALIVVGPKDLPHLFHALGRFTAKARGMAREFSSAMEDAAKGSGLDEASKSLRDVKNLTSKKSLGLDALDRAADRFEKWDPKRPAPKGAGLQPDPDAPATPQAVAKAAAPVTGPLPAAAGASAAAATPVLAAPQATPAASPAGTGDAPASARRLHAVRRRDMKDD